MLKSMNISFTVNEAYVKYLTVAMRSILDNAEDGEEFRFYVINSGIGEDSKRKLESLKSIRDFYILSNSGLSEEIRRRKFVS